MRIDKLHLKNYRNFEDAEFRLNPHFTVVIGENGKGKSTLLSALCVAMGGYGITLKDYGIPQSKIELDDLRKFINPHTGWIEESKEAKVTADGTWGAWERGASVKAKSLVASEQIENLKRVALERDEDPSEFSNPVLCFFGTGRMYEAGKRRKKDERFPGIRGYQDGYEDWNRMRATKYQYQRWLGETALAAEDETTIEFKWHKAFYHTIQTAIPYIQKIKYVNDEFVIECEIDDIKYPRLPLRLLSDGMKVMVEMVAELAYRCIALNGYAEKENAILLSAGIVLIDELDMHLHPNWQRKVVQNLKYAFENIQFIVTTHSPFIVQSLAKDELINLDNPELQESEDPIKMVLGEVVTTVMGVENLKSDKFEERYEQAMSELKTIVQKGKPTLKDLLAVKEKLEKVLVEDTNDPIFKAYLKSKDL